jgi:transposase
MRVAELFKRLLGLSGVQVAGVELRERAGGPLVVVWITRPRRRRMACSGCGQIVAAVYDRAERRWRHRDLGAARCEIRAEVRRLDCPGCGVRAEALPWARPGSRFTRPFEDTCAWLVRCAPQSVVARLMRIDWETVGRIARRVVAEQRAGADGLDGLRRIGVDEVSWKAGHNYLTVVVCHDSGRVVWVGAGDPARALIRFFRELGPARAGMIEAISLDLAPRFHAVVAHHAPAAAICADPFHLVAMAQFALDRLRAAEWQGLRREDPEAGRWLKGARFALARGPARRTRADHDLIAELAEANQGLYRAHLWCDQLRATLRLGDPGAAAAQLGQLAQVAPALGHRRFARLAGTLARHHEHILNTIRHRISNGRIEALNSTVRLLSHRARGYRRIDNLIGLIHLVCGRVRVELPT